MKIKITKRSEFHGIIYAECPTACSRQKFNILSVISLSWHKCLSVVNTESTPFKFQLLKRSSDWDRKRLKMTTHIYKNINHNTGGSNLIIFPSFRITYSSKNLSSWSIIFKKIGNWSDLDKFLILIFRICSIILSYFGEPL